MKKFFIFVYFFSLGLSSFAMDKATHTDGSVPVDRLKILELQDQNTDVLLSITRFLSPTDLLSFGMVCTNWYRVYQDEWKKENNVEVRLEITRKLIEQKIRNQKDMESIDILDHTLSYINSIGSKYLYIFLNYARFGIEGQSISFKDTTDENDMAIDKVLKPWNTTIYLFNKHKENVRNLVKKHMIVFLTGKASILCKLNLLEVMNNPNTKRMNVRCNTVEVKPHYYDPDTCFSILTELLPILETDQAEYKEATLFLLPKFTHYQASFSPYFGEKTIEEPRQKDPIPLDKILLKKLADVGSIWHKIQYANKFAAYSEEPIFGDPFQPTLQNIHKLIQEADSSGDYFLNSICMFNPHIDFDPNIEVNPNVSIEGMLEDEMIVQMLKECFTPIIGTRVIDNERGEYIDAAIKQAITHDNVDEALALFRLIHHQGGYLTAIYDQTPIRDFVFLGHNPSSKSQWITHAEKLQDYLKEKNTDNPPFLAGDQITIQELSSLTEEQALIVNQLEIAKSEKPSGMKSGSQEGTHIDHIGSFTSIGNLTVIQGGIEAVVEKFVIKTLGTPGPDGTVTTSSMGTDTYLKSDTLVTEGVAYIKAKEVKIEGDFDAFKGAVIVAEKFDLSPNARIWNPKNTHFIKVPKIKLDGSLQISE